MSLFQDILTQVSKRLQGAQGHTEDIARIVSETVGVTVTPDDIHMKNGVLFIHVSPTVKAAIRFKQQKLLEALQSYGVSTIG